MRKTTIWIMVVATALAMNIMFAQAALALESQAPGSTSSLGAWTFGCSASAPYSRDGKRGYSS